MIQKHISWETSIPEGAQRVSMTVHLPYSPDLLVNNPLYLSVDSCTFMEKKILGNMIHSLGMMYGVIEDDIIKNHSPWMKDEVRQNVKEAFDSLLEKGFLIETASLDFKGKYVQGSVPRYKVNLFTTTTKKKEDIEQEREITGRVNDLYERMKTYGEPLNYRDAQILYRRFDDPEKEEKEAKDFSDALDELVRKGYIEKFSPFSEKEYYHYYKVRDEEFSHLTPQEKELFDFLLSHEPLLSLSYILEHYTPEDPNYSGGQNRETMNTLDSLQEKKYIMKIRSSSSPSHLTYYSVNPSWRKK